MSMPSPIAASPCMISGDTAKRWQAMNGHLRCNPDHAAALSNRGLSLHKLGRLDEALASYDRALATQPDYADALVNRGVTLHDLKRFDEALASYDRAIALRPDHADAHFFGSLSRLLTGDFGRGWIEYEWRRKGASTGTSKARFPATALARRRGDRRQDHPASQRAGIWRHHSILPLCAAGRSARRARRPGGRGAASGAFDRPRRRRRGSSPKAISCLISTCNVLFSACRWHSGRSLKRSRPRCPICARRIGRC